MIPTVEDVEGWHPDLLNERAPAVLRLADDVRDTLGQLSNQTARLWPSWRGRAADACEDHLDYEKKSYQKLADQLGALSTAFSEAGNALNSAVRKAHETIAVARAAQFTVNNSGVFPTDQTVLAPGDPDAASHAAAISDALGVVGDIDDAQTSLINAIADLITEATPQPALITGADGTHDWASFTDGNLQTEDIRRLLANLGAAGLDSQALAQLSAGTTVSTLPPGALDYLEQLYREGGLAGFLDLQAALASDGSPAALSAKDALSSGILALSNENAHDSNDQAGGWDRVPADIRASITARPGDAVPESLDDYLATLTSDQRIALETTPGAAASAHRDALAYPDQAYVRNAVEAEQFWSHITAPLGWPWISPILTSPAPYQSPKHRPALRRSHSIKQTSALRAVSDCYNTLWERAECH